MSEEVKTSEASLAKDGEVEVTPVKKFTAEEVEDIVRKRLARESKKLSKVEATTEKPSDNLVGDLKSKLGQYEQSQRNLEQKLAQMRVKTVQATVEKRLAESGCQDPEMVAESFLSKKLVHLDDDDNIVVENVTNSLDDLVKDTLSRKPFLVKASGGGLGTKSPATTNTDPSKMTREQMEAALGITSKKNSLFGR